MTQRSELADVLGAESLLLTLITFAYGLLYPELSRAAAMQLGGRQIEDVGSDRARVRAARRRAAALAVVAIALGAIFIPPSVEATWHFLRRLPEGLDATDDYNPVATTLVLVAIGFFLIAAHALWMVTRLTTALRRLS
jgi:ABC-type Fe3+ transport system permease subunit